MAIDLKIRNRKRLGHDSKTFMKTFEKARNAARAITRLRILMQPERFTVIMPKRYMKIVRNRTTKTNFQTLTKQLNNVALTFPTFDGDQISGIETL